MHTLTIVGVGLLGGSIGLATKKRGLAKIVRGVGRSQDTLDRARELGAIDETSLDLASAAAASELIVLCTPVDRIAEQVMEMVPHCRPGTLITDVGSTKGTIVQAVEDFLAPRAEDSSSAGADVHFIGSHPLAGSEKQGSQFADANLFQNRWTIVARTARTDVTALDRVMTFWQELGARVRVMDPAEHDRALAMTSHLPHLLAAALAGILPMEWNELTAGGFRDTTRIAAGDVELWNAIFTHNRQALLAALRPFTTRLEAFHQALETSDWTAVKRLLTQAKKIRDGLNG